MVHCLLIGRGEQRSRSAGQPDLLDTMRSLLAVFPAAVWLAAQSPSVTTFSHDNGGTVGGAVYFDLESLRPAGVTIPPNVAGSLNGYQFCVQSVVFGSNANTFLGRGAVTSNGLQATIGDV